ncbi:MAG: methyltransferase domain-containing protein [Pseudomonadota bacterium]
MSDTSAFEKMEFEGWSDPGIAKGYADSFAFATRVVAQRLSDAVLAGPQTRVLDLCTGHGVVAKEILARGASVVGLDFSSSMIALARSAAPQAHFVQGNAMAMDFADHSFDAVTIGFGVPHFPDPALGLSEAARVLKPGGRIAFSIWKGKGSEGAFGWLFDAVGRLGDPAITLPEGPDAHLLATSAIAKPMVREAGFVDVQSVEMATELSIATPEALFDAFDRGAVRAASLLGGQPAAQRDAIRADLAARTRSDGIKREDGYLVPAPSVLVSAVRG